MSDFDEKIIIDAITRMLARREHSAVEIGRKLRAKAIPESEFLPVLTRFIDAGVQSNQRFAESRARMLSRKGQGPLKIRADLAQHDIDEADINTAFSELDVDWFALAADVREKKFGQVLPSDYKTRAKQMQFLQYRGFDMEQIQFAVRGT